MCLPEHTKIQSGEREGENCEEGVDPAHVQTKNLTTLEEVRTVHVLTNIFEKVDTHLILYIC